MANGTYNQIHARFRNDDGTETTSTWKAAEDTNITLQQNVNFKVRMSINCTNSSGNLTANLYYSRNSGAYTAVTTSSNYVKAVSSTQGVSYAGNTPTTQQMVESGTFTAGTTSVNGTTAIQSLSSGQVTEYEYVLQLVGCSPGDTIDLEVYNINAAFTGSYTVVPRITLANSTMMQNRCMGMCIGFGI